MIHVLIIEDESHAAERLETLINDSSFDISIVGHCDSVKSSISWLNTNELPELIFSDIQLGDGTSFDIFQQVSVQCPIIFVTAFDSYAIKAFDVFCIDYILKPYELEQINKAFAKFTSHVNKPHVNNELLKNLELAISAKYKSRFFSQKGDKIYTITTDQIACLLFEDGFVVLLDKERKKFVLSHSLDVLETLINPSDFFRVNRKIIVNYDSLYDMKVYPKGRIEFKVKGLDETVVVSRRRNTEFRKWLDK